MLEQNIDASKRFADPLGGLAKVCSRHLDVRVGPNSIGDFVTRHPPILMNRKVGDEFGGRFRCERDGFFCEARELAHQSYLNGSVLNSQMRSRVHAKYLPVYDTKRAKTTPFVDFSSIILGFRLPTEARRCDNVFCI